jgi:hypothetical protein
VACLLITAHCATASLLLVESVDHKEECRGEEAMCTLVHPHVFYSMLWRGTIRYHQCFGKTRKLQERLRRLFAQGPSMHGKKRQHTRQLSGGGRRYLPANPIVIYIHSVRENCRNLTKSVDTSTPGPGRRWLFIQKFHRGSFGGVRSSHGKHHLPFCRQVERARRFARTGFGTVSPSTLSRRRKA